MLKRHCAVVAGTLFVILGCGGAEEVAGVPDRTATVPTGWFGGSSVGNNFYVGFDRGIKHGGGVAGFVEAAGISVEGIGVLSQQVKADRYRGQRIRWSAWVRSRDLSGLGAGLWMRIDGPGTLQGFDNMLNRPLLGTTGWHEVAIVLDVPTNAIGISMGALNAGPGDVMLDDCRFEIVGKDIGVTAPVANAPGIGDSATVVNVYARSNLSPLNLDFESNRASMDRTSDQGTLRVAGGGGGAASTITGSSTTLSRTRAVSLARPGL